MKKCFYFFTFYFYLHKLIKNINNLLKTIFFFFCTQTLDDDLLCIICYNIYITYIRQEREREKRGKRVGK